MEQAASNKGLKSIFKSGPVLFNRNESIREIVERNKIRNARI